MTGRSHGSQSRCEPGTDPPVHTEPTALGALHPPAHTDPTNLGVVDPPVHTDPTALGVVDPPVHTDPTAPAGDDPLVDAERRAAGGEAVGYRTGRPVSCQTLLLSHTTPGPEDRTP